MFPMISEPWEFDAAREIVEQQREWLASRGSSMSSISASAGTSSIAP